jgi:hypothetical protein
MYSYGHLQCTRSRKRKLLPTAVNPSRDSAVQRSTEELAHRPTHITPAFYLPTDDCCWFCECDAAIQLQGVTNTEQGVRWWTAKAWPGTLATEHLPSACSPATESYHVLWAAAFRQCSVFSPGLLGWGHSCHPHCWQISRSRSTPAFGTPHCQVRLF